MEVVGYIIKRASAFAAGLPEFYVIAGGVIFTVLVIWWSGWLSARAINVVVRVFRLGGRHGPSGAALAAKMLAAAGEAGVEVDESIMDSSFRRAFGNIDYQPGSGVLELTEDKARGATISSAGLVVMEVGRALQYRRRFPLVYVQRVMAPFVNFAGFAWIWPGVAANLVPIFLKGPNGPTLEHYLYAASTAMVGLIFLFLLMRVPLELDAARRGVAAMKGAGVFSFGEAWAIRIFLAAVLAITIVATLLVALNIFRSTVRGSK